MTTESIIFDTLKTLVSNRVYPDLAPLGVGRPFITFQQVGGQSINFLDAATTPSKSNGRYQVNVWADTRAAAALLIKQVETALRAATTLQTTVLAQPVASYEPDTTLYGARQDFSFWTT